MRPGTAVELHRLLLRVGFAACNAFAWLFIFRYFEAHGEPVTNAIVRTVLLYALSQTIACLCTPAAARALRRGVRRELMLSVALIAAALVMLGQSFQGGYGQYDFLALLVFSMAFGLYRALYWVPYEVERSKLPSRTSPLSTELMLALIPAFAGILLETAGVSPMALLCGAAAAMTLAIIPLFAVHESYEGFPWSSREAFGTLFSRQYRRVFLTSMIDGVEGAALLLIWPLAIFLMIAQSFSLFGLIFSFSLLILLMIRGGLTHRSGRPLILGSMPVRVAIVTSGWVGRIFVINPLSLILANSYLHAGRSHVTVDHFSFEQTSDGGHYVDEITVLREMGLTVGRIALCVLFGATLGFLALPLAFGACFVLVAAAAGVSVMLLETTPQTM